MSIEWRFKTIQFGLSNRSSSNPIAALIADGASGIRCDNILILALTDFRFDHMLSFQIKKIIEIISKNGKKYVKFICRLNI